MSETETLVANDLFTGKAVSVRIERGAVASISPAETAPDNLYLCPGFLDPQVNGFAGINLQDGEIETEKLSRLMGELFHRGVSRILATVVTAPYDRMAACLRSMVKAQKENRTLRDAIAGFHLEGPWISGEEGARGVHPETSVRRPDWDAFLRLNEAAEGQIRYVTVAPEIEGMSAFVEKLSRAGVIVGLGHSNGLHEQYMLCVNAGARISTHLGNGIKPLQHRHRSALWTQLAEDRLFASIIADGHHLPRQVIECFYRCKGRERLILTSDSSDVAGLPAGEYVFAGLTVVLEKDGFLHVKDSEIMAGSCISQKEAVETMLRFRICPLDAAVEMATVTPAELFGVQGLKLKEGKPADCMLFRFDPTLQRIEPIRMYLNGAKVLGK